MKPTRVAEFGRSLGSWLGSNDVLKNHLFADLGPVVAPGTARVGCVPYPSVAAFRPLIFSGIRLLVNRR